MIFEWILECERIEWPSIYTYALYVYIMFYVYTLNGT